MSDNDDWMMELQGPTKATNKKRQSSKRRKGNELAVFKPNGGNDGTKSEDSGPPITYAKVENFQRL